MSKLLHTVLFLLITFSGFADCINCKIKSAVNDYLKVHNGLNAVYQFSHNGNVVTKGAAGYFSVEKNIKLTQDQVMPVASVTKNIIAAAILKLEEDGLLKVSDTLDKFFPKDSLMWQINASNRSLFPKWAQKVQIHHLLTHSSGICEYVFKVNIDLNKSHDDINKQILQFAALQPIEFTPGQKSHYSNTGYVILGMIIENVSQKKLADYLKETFFDNLGMNNTRLASLQQFIDYFSGKSQEYPEVYFARYSNEKFILKHAKTNFNFVPYADGGIISNAQDIAKWFYHLHNGKILTQTAYQKMITPYFYLPSYDQFGSSTRGVGYGIFIAALNQLDVVYYHSGRAAGARSEAGYIPSKEVSFAVISNVMPIASLEKMQQINLTNSSSQIDIFFFVDYVIRNIIKSN